MALMVDTKHLKKNDINSAQTLPENRSREITMQCYSNTKDKDTIRKLQTKLSQEYRRKNSQRATKSNSNNCTLQPSRIYSTYAKLNQHLKNQLR